MSQTPLPLPQNQEPPVKPTEIPGRGRALVATRTIKPGEVILVDTPLLLYPTLLPSSSFCPHCFKSFISPPFPCRSSCPSLFCSPSCLSAHPPSLCHLLRHHPLPADPDLATQYLFLSAAYSLSLSSPAPFNRLLTLHGGGRGPGALSPLPPSPFPPDLTAALLSKDRFNAFGLMEPFTQGGERKVRGYGIYPVASLFNHDCLPNACRFDYVDMVDGPGGRNTDIVVRAIHEISEGREVCLSYFPVNWRYRERQRRLMEEYGFRCECDRCNVEKDWKDDEDEEGMGMGSGGGDEGMEGMEDSDDVDFPHAFFFIKFVCDREDCGGTLAPLPPTPEGVVSDMMECNVCGRLKKDEDVDGDENGDMIDNE